MSDNNEAVEAVESVEADETATDAGEGNSAPDSVSETEAEHEGDPDDVASMNAEAAKWRRKLRETQAELEAAAAQLDAVQRQQVEFLLAKSGVKPEAVFAVAEMSDLLNDDGGIDADKLDAAMATAQEKFGIVKPPKGNFVPGIGNRPNGLPRVDAWREAFSPAPKR